MEKEQFYTTENIDVVAKQYCDKLTKFSAKHNFTLDKKHAALLVIDMQDFFTDPKARAFIPSVTATIPKIKMLQDAFLKNKMPVLQTQQINTKTNGANMLNWWRSIITVQEPLHTITAELKNPHIPIISKTQYDAFTNTNLAELLRQQNITQLVITGVMTHLCCETTARSAFMRGFETFFVVDCNTTYNSKFHRATLLNLAHGFAVPTLSGKLLKDLT